MVTPIINANFLSKNNLNFNHNFTASEEYNLFMKICALSPVMVQKKFWVLIGFTKSRLQTNS